MQGAFWAAILRAAMSASDNPIVQIHIHLLVATLPGRATF
jgi:hypothetical protein